MKNHYFYHFLNWLEDKFVSNEKDARGFTLLELLIIVFIVGILSAVAYPNLLKQIDKARYTQAVLDMDCIADDLRRHYYERQFFPSDVARNVKPAGGISCFPISSEQDIPFDSIYDYESWSVSGSCYIQITFLGKNGERDSPTGIALFPEQGVYDSHPTENIGDDLIFSLGIFDVPCR